MTLHQTHIPFPGQSHDDFHFGDAPHEEMSADDFVRALKATPRDWWTLDGSGRIRRYINDGDELGPLECCPITSGVGGLEPDHCDCFADQAEKLGIPLMYAESVAIAADNGKFADPALRAKLLAACGLEGVEC